MKFERKNWGALIVAILAVATFSMINNSSVFFDFFKKIIGYFSVFIMGAVIAFFLNPLLDFLEKKLKLSRRKSIVIIYFGLLLSIVIFILLVVPKLVKNISDLIQVFPNYLIRFEGFANKYIDKYIDKIPYLDSNVVKEQLDKINDTALTITQKALKIIAENIVSVTFSIVEFAMAFIMSIFFLSQKEYFRNLASEVTDVYFSNENAKKIKFYGGKLNEVFLSYLHGKTLDSVIIGLIAFVGLLFFKVPYAVFLWLFITFTNFIPYFGPFLGMLLSGIIMAFAFPKRVFFVVLYLIGVQQFDAWFLEPRILGNKLNLKMFWSIAAITIGGSIAGPLGIVLAAPVAGLVKEMYNLKREKMGLKVEENN